MNTRKELRLEQDWNAKSPMLVTLLGIVTIVRLLQPPNAYHPMLVTLLGIVTLVKLMQFAKTAFPIAVRLLVLGAITAVAYALWDVAMRRGNLNLVAAASYTTPLLSTIVSFLYLQVAPGPKLWAGCALIVLGSLASWRAIKPDAPRITSAAETLKLHPGG